MRTLDAECASYLTLRWLGWTGAGSGTQLLGIHLSVPSNYRVECNIQLKMQINCKSVIFVYKLCSNILLFILYTHKFSRSCVCRYAEFVWMNTIDILLFVLCVYLYSYVVQPIPVPP